MAPGRTYVALVIHEVSGDILLTSAHAIAHGVAPNDPFDRGLALALRERWPAMYKDLRHYWHNTHADPGTAWAWGTAGGPRIVALFTQDPGPAPHGHPGPARLEHVNHALKALGQLVESEQYESLALPRLATGVGRLDWKDVRPLVDHHLGGLKIPVYLYSTFHSGERAKEPS